MYIFGDDIHIYNTQYKYIYFGQISWVSPYLVHYLSLDCLPQLQNVRMIHFINDLLAKMGLPWRRFVERIKESVVVCRESNYCNPFGTSMLISFV